jgi:phosphoglycolate phosphatase-like HAD superfamily hydrolase
VANIMDGFGELHVHPDVPDGLSALAELGIRLVTLSNGSASIAQRLLSSAGLDSHLERFLSPPTPWPNRRGSTGPGQRPQLLPAADPPGRLSAAACAPAALT